MISDFWILIYFIEETNQAHNHGGELVSRNSCDSDGLRDGNNPALPKLPFNGIKRKHPRQPPLCDCSRSLRDAE